MKLISNSAREIELNEQETRDFLRAAGLRGESQARTLAFAGDLPSQLTPEIVAARQVAKAANRAVRKQKRQDAIAEDLRQSAIKQGLRHLVPGIPLLAYERIIHRGRHYFPRSKLPFFQPKPEPVQWQGLSAQEQAAALTAVNEILGLLNSNDWRRIRPLISNEDFQRTVAHANPEAIASLL